MGHIQGQSRHQGTLFPEALDELVSEEHPVRVVDAFVDSLVGGYPEKAQSVAELQYTAPWYSEMGVIAVGPLGSAD